MRKSLVSLLFVMFLCGCSEQAQKISDDYGTYETALDSGKETLVFAVYDSEPDEFSIGRIDGEAEPRIPDLEPGIDFRQMDAKPGAFFEPFRQCGEKKAMYEDFGHGYFISVPIGANSPERNELMTDVEFVDCIKKRVSFSFYAGRGRFPNIDYKAFESLHAQKN